jgi:hypothetical protein
LAVKKSRKKLKKAHISTENRILEPKGLQSLSSVCASKMSDKTKFFYKKFLKNYSHFLHQKRSFSKNRSKFLFLPET